MADWKTHFCNIDTGPAIWKSSLKVLGEACEPVWPSGKTRMVNRRTSARVRLGSPLSSKGVLCGHGLVTLSLTANQTLKCISSLPILIQEWFWRWQCSVRYSLPLPHLLRPRSPPVPLSRDNSALNKFNQTKVGESISVVHTASPMFLSLSILDRIWGLNRKSWHRHDEIYIHMTVLSLSEEGVFCE